VANAQRQSECEGYIKNRIPYPENCSPLEMSNDQFRARYENRFLGVLNRQMTWKGVVDSSGRQADERSWGRGPGRHG